MNLNNTYIAQHCVSVTTMDTRKRHIVTLHIHILSRIHLWHWFSNCAPRIPRDPRPFRREFVGTCL